MVSRVKSIFSCAAVLLLLCSALQAGQDPVLEYMKAYSAIGGDERVWADDVLLRLDLDVDGDGKKEVLLCMASDRNGRAGNCWSFYQEFDGDFVYVGGATFNTPLFYTGPVSEVKGFALVTFWSAGGGEGQILAHTLRDRKTNESRIGAVERIPNSEHFRGEGLFEKYLSQPQWSSNPRPERILATELHEKYGWKIEPLTRYQFIESETAKSEAAAAQKLAAPKPSEPEVGAKGNVVASPANLAVPSTGSGESAEDGFHKRVLLSLVAMGLLGAMVVLHYMRGQ